MVINYTILSYLYFDAQDGSFPYEVEGPSLRPRIILVAIAADRVCQRWGYIVANVMLY